MELTQVRSEEPLLQNVQRSSRTSWLQYLGICSFGLLLGATVVLALLHFNIIGPKKQDELPVPEVLQIKNYLESAPETQAMHGKRASAHLMGKMENNDITWQTTSSNAFQDGSIKFRENSLEIEQDGLYFVYTHVVFTGKDCPKDREFSHSVFKKSEDEPILNSSKTVCDEKSKASWTQPIYQAGLFKLEEGDVLYTKTSDVKYLDTFSGQVYFGILAV